MEKYCIISFHAVSCFAALNCGEVIFPSLVRTRDASTHGSATINPRRLARVTEAKK
jgi:hypothetical protein